MSLHGACEEGKRLPPLLNARDLLEYFRGETQTSPGIEEGRQQPRRWSSIQSNRARRKEAGGGGVSTTVIFRLVSYLILAILQGPRPYDLDLLHGPVLSVRLDEPQPSHDAHAALDASKDSMFPI